MRSRAKVQLPLDWVNATDRDYLIGGRKSKDYYRLADVWLRSEVEASRLANTDPQRATGLIETAKQARDEMTRAAGRAWMRTSICRHRRSLRQAIACTQYQSRAAGDPRVFIS
jgi:hypothetical protein